MMNHANELSISRLVNKANKGDKEANNTLAEFFFEHAMRMARGKLSKSPSAQSDHEDIAVSAMKSFCNGIEEGRIKFVGARELTALLREIVSRKAKKLWRYHFAEIRDVRRDAEPGQSNPVDDDSGPGYFDQIIAANDDSILVNDQEIRLNDYERKAADRVLESLDIELHGVFQALLAELDEHPRRALFLLLEEDLSNDELANRLGRAKSSAERYRNLIREKLSSITSKCE